MASYAELTEWANRMGGQADQQAAASRARYEHALGGFDPQGYAATTAGSIYNALSEDFAARESSRSAGLNARGLFRSNIGGAAAGRGMQDRMAQAMAGLSMQAGQMEQQRLGMMGNLYGMDQDQQRFYHDARVGLGVSAEQQQRVDSAAKRDMWGNIIGGGISAAGDVLGGYLAGRSGNPQPEQPKKKGLFGKIIGGLAGVAGTVLGGPATGALASGVTNRFFG